MIYREPGINRVSMRKHGHNQNERDVLAPATGTAAEAPGLEAAISTALVKKGVVARAASVSARTVEMWMLEKRIPYVRLSPRCVRFHLPSVLAALNRSTVREVGGQ